MTFSIPDLSDPTKRAMLPPSQHKTNAGLLLQGCAEIQDPLAIKHILTAVYLNTYTTAPGVRDTALLFPKSEIIKYRKSLEALQLAGKDDPEALTLHGQFLEKENRRAEARALYEKALQVPWIYAYNAQARHPVQLPIIAPWNALGYLLKASNDAAARERAKWAFEHGAIKGDDPLSYYELSLFHDRSSVEWLKCVSKAAASGHREAMFQVAQFYRDVSSADSSLKRDAEAGGLKSALGWLLGWQKGSDARLAVEWFEAAGKAGHKRALLELADWYEASGRKDDARAVLQSIIEPNEDGKEEEFPAVVHQAKGRLIGVRTK
jgi:tetratricopeptide (TPR) repeat protein